MPFDEFLQKRVLDPLGMKDTSFWIAPEKESRWAHSYRWNPQAARLEETAIPYLYKTAVTDRDVRRSVGPGFSRPPRTSPDSIK